MTIEEIKTLDSAGIEARWAEIRAEMEAEDADLDALSAEVDALTERRDALKQDAETRKALADKVAGGAGVTIATINTETEEPKMTETEKRAQELVETGRIEMRQLLSTGTIAKPSEVGGINGLGEVGNDIVDDVHAFSLTGNGSWIAAYKVTDAEAAAVTDGSAVGGTASTYNYVTISPSEWGVLDEISKQVRKLTPLSYLAAIEESAVIALRNYASSKIVTAIQNSSIAQAVTAPLDADYLRTLALGFRAIPGKGDVRLYLAQADLLTLGKVRGTNEKRPLYTITFDAGTTTSGVISEGGLAVKFRVIDELTAGTQLFGQPGTVDMPMWDGYSVETDEGGDYFKRNMIGIRGLQTAGADLVAKYGMQVVSNA